MPKAKGIGEVAVTLARKGLPPRVIAEHLDTCPANVSKFLSDARQQGEDIPRFAPGRPCGWSGQNYVLARFPDDLERAADQRGISADELAETLLRLVCEDNLIDSILDEDS